MKRFLAIIPIPNSPLVRVVRNSLPPRSAEEMEETWSGLAREIARLDHSRRVLLLDLRRTPGRSDEAFENVVARYRAETFRGFVRVALLVSTLRGLMQIERHGSHDRPGFVRTFVDEKEALRWLDEAEVPSADDPPRSALVAVRGAEGIQPAASNAVELAGLEEAI